MTGVQAEIHIAAVRPIEESVHVALGVDMGVGVRMVLRTDTVGFEHRLAECVHALGLLTPLLVGEHPVFEHHTGRRITPHLGDDNDVRATHRGSQPRDVLDLRPHRVPCIVFVQMLENRSGGELQPP